MIKGRRKLDLSPESVLNMISDFDIFRQYMPTRDWKINEVTHSCFHPDENPSFLISNRGGSGLHFIDFAQPDKRGGPIDFVMCRYGLNLDEALRKIDADFGLGFISTTNVGKYKEIVSEYKQPESTGKRYSLIQVVTRKFTKDELFFWEEYYQDVDDLRTDNIYSIKEAYLNRRRYFIGENELRFGYLFNGYWKLYFPNREKKRKWISNVPITHAFGLENLSPEHNSLVLNSLKDYKVCRKVYPYCCGVQNESLAAFSQETVEYINTHSREVFYGGDSDMPGKKASYCITEAFGWRHINPPDRLLPDTKDWAKMGKDYSLQSIEEHFKIKGLS